MNETDTNRLRGEVAFKDIIPLLARVSEGDVSLTKKMLERFEAFRDAFQSENAPDDNASLSEWVTWSTNKE